MGHLHTLLFGVLRNDTLFPGCSNNRRMRRACCIVRARSARRLRGLVRTEKRHASGRGSGLGSPPSQFWDFWVERLMAGLTRMELRNLKLYNNKMPSSGENKIPFIFNHCFYYVFARWLRFGKIANEACIAPFLAEGRTAGWFRRPRSFCVLTRHRRRRKQRESGESALHFRHPRAGIEHEHNLTREPTMKCMSIVLAAVGALAAAAPASAQGSKVAIGISGWTGFAPLVFAKEAGIFSSNGLDVTLKKIPQASRHLAIASGDIQCAATTVETWIVWNANGVATTQLFQMDKSYGADGMVVRNSIASIKDVKGKTVAASAPGTAPYFTLAWFLKKNGLALKDVTVVTLEPAAAAQAFIAGQNDAAMTYEPYLSAVREKPEAGKIIATTLDYPMVMDTFGCTPKFIAENETAVKALVKSYFDAVEAIKADPKKAYEIMGADVKQTGEQFANSAKYLRWQDRTANATFFAGEFPAFNKEAADLLLEIGVIKQIPDLGKIADIRFIQ
jgi:NitT/TauT family transport system substrate-binding protein